MCLKAIAKRRIVELIIKMWYTISSRFKRRSFGRFLSPSIIDRPRYSLLIVINSPRNYIWKLLVSPISGVKPRLFTPWRSDCCINFSSWLAKYNFVPLSFSLSLLHSRSDTRFCLLELEEFLDTATTCFQQVCLLRRPGELWSLGWSNR